MRWVILTIAVFASLDALTQENVLPISTVETFRHHSIDSLLVHCKIDQSVFDVQHSVETITETKHGVSALFIKSSAAWEFPFFNPAPGHRIQMEEVESYDVNLDGVYDLIVTLSHHSAQSTVAENFRETVRTKHILDTVHSTILLNDTTFIERTNLPLLADQSDLDSLAMTCNCLIHVFEGKIVFMPCLGKKCERTVATEERVYLWNGTAFTLEAH